MNKEGMLPALTSLIIVSIVVVSVISFLIYNVRLIGPIIVLLGFFLKF
jgi:hypothetical protein